EHELLALLVALGDVRTPLQDLEESARIARLFVQAFERRERFRLVRLELERLLVVLARKLPIAQLVSGEIRDLERDLELDRPVEDVGNDLAQELDVLLVSPRLPREPIQVLEP